MFPVLYEQSMESLALPEKYDAIIIAIGSFQLLHGRDKALAVLNCLKSHLYTCGKLFVETFVPWETLYENAAHEICSSEAIAPDGSIINITSENNANISEQYYVGNNTYQKTKDGKVIATEKEELPVCWYYHYEMQYFLEKAGFTRVILHDVDFSQNPKGIVYEAVS